MGLIKCISRLMTLFGFGLRLRSFFCVLVASLFFFTVSSHADELYWSGPGMVYGSSVVCPDQAGATYSGINYAGSGNSATCQYSYVDGYGESHTINVNTFTQQNFICASTMHIDKSNYNSWQCVNGAPPVANKCTAVKDAVIPSFHWLSATDSPPPIISINGCAAAISGFIICKTASPSVFSCTGRATFSGDELPVSLSGAASTCSGSNCSDGEQIGRAHV